VEAGSEGRGALILPEGVARGAVPGHVQGAHVEGVEVVAVDDDVARAQGAGGIAHVHAIRRLLRRVQPELRVPVADQERRARRVLIVHLKLAPLAVDVARTEEQALGLGCLGLADL
jgi:hypothetical protein